MDSGKKLQWEITKEFNIYLRFNVKILVSVKHQVLKKPFAAEIIISEFSLHIYFFLAFPNTQLHSPLQYVGSYLN